MKPIIIGKAYNFNVQISINGTVVDISSDTVKAIISDHKTTRKEFGADTVTNGTNGIAIFDLTNTDTQDMKEGFYDLEIWWEPAPTKNYVINKQTIEVTPAL